MADDSSKQAEQSRKGVSDWFREAWSHAIVKVSVAEEEAGKVLNKVGDVAGWGPEEARRIAKDFGERLASQRKELEKSLDDQVQRALSRVKAPRRDEIEALQKRVARLTQRVEALASKRS